MKIGLIVPGFSASESDWCIPALLDTVRILAAHHDVHVFTLRYPHQRRDYTVYGAHVHALGGGTTARLGRLRLLWDAVRAVTNEAKRGQFDILHGLWADEPGFVTVTAARRLRVKSIVSLMGGELVRMPDIGYGHQLSFSARQMIRHSLNRADSVAVGSDILFDQAAAFGVNPQKMVVAPLGVDTTLFTPQGEQAALEGGFKLLHVASLEPIKNQAILLNAAAQARQAVPNLHLHIIGDGRLRDTLARTALSLGIEQAVTFHGNVSRERLPAYFRAADVCVLTSFHESQSLVALEAAACGRATIGTRVGLLPELLPNHDFAAPNPNDLAEIAEIIVKLAQDDDHRAKCHAQAYQQTVTKFSLEARTAFWVELYRCLNSTPLAPDDAKRVS